MALTAKQEAFAQGVVSGLSQADAYRKAYNAKNMKDATIHVKASELMADGKMAGRVETLRKPVIEELRYDLKMAMLEAEDAMKVSKDNKQGGAMVAAAQLRAKLNGLLVERKEIKVSVIESLAESELDRLIARKAQESGVSLH